jgi:hypothetical protein
VESVVIACMERLDFQQVSSTVTRHEALVRAARGGHRDVVQRLLDAIEGINPFFSTISMASAVHVAIQHKHIGVCEQLLAFAGERGVEPLESSPDDAVLASTALGQALLVAKDEATALRVLHLCGVRASLLTDAIHAALVAGLSSVAVELLQRASTLTIADSMWVDFFKLAIEFCDVRPFACILARGGHAIDVCAAHNTFAVKTVGTQFAVNFAALRGQLDVLQLLLPRTGDKLAEALESALRISVRGAHEDVVRSLLSHPAMVSVPPNIGSFITVRFGAMAALLLESKLVLERCDWTSTLVMCFALSQPAEVADALDAVTLILERAGDRVADVNSLSYAFHPLKWALQHRHSALFESVLRHPSFKLAPGAAQSVLVQIVFNNDAAALRRLLHDARINVEHHKRCLRPPRIPQAANGRLDLFLTATEAAVELRRYDLLEILLADARFDPSADRNALLRMLCGLVHSIELESQCLWLVGGFDLARHDWGQHATQPYAIEAGLPDADRELSLIDSVLHHQRFRPVAGAHPHEHGSVTVILGELCEANVILQLASDIQLPPPTAQGGRWNTPAPAAAGRAQLVRALLDGSDAIHFELLDTSTVSDAKLLQLLKRRMIR